MIETGRRDFLKLIGLGGAVAVMPKLLVEQLEEIVSDDLALPDILSTLMFKTNDGLKTYNLGMLNRFIPPRLFNRYTHIGGSYSPTFVKSYRDSNCDLIEETRVMVDITPDHADQIMRYMRHMMQPNSPFNPGMYSEYRGTMLGEATLPNGKILRTTLSDTFITGYDDICFLSRSELMTTTLTFAGGIPATNLKWEIV